MTQPAPQSAYRKREGLGVWEHRGKVAAVGIAATQLDVGTVLPQTVSEPLL